MELQEFFTELKPYAVALHALGAIVGMGIALTSDIMFSFYSHDRVFTARERHILERLSRTIWIALMVIIASGAALFLSDPLRYMDSDKFLIKMSIVAILTANGYFLSRWIQPHMARGGFLTSPEERLARKAAFACGAVSLISWGSAFGLGMLDTIPFSYMTMLAAYLGIVACGIICSLFIEKRSFE